jgi:hypothetical protein
LYLFFSPICETSNKNSSIRGSFKAKTILSCFKKGPLSLECSIEQDSFSALRQEIVLIANNPSPDTPGVNGDFMLYLRSSQSRKAVQRGQTIFLSCDAMPGGLAPSYHFCEHKTPLWIKVDFSTDATPALEAGLFTLAKDSSLFEEEKTQWSLERDSSFDKNTSSCLFVDLLKKAKVWGKDVVIPRLGGEKYAYLQDKIKLEIPFQGKRTFCFVKKGDFLRYGDLGWELSPANELLANSPIAYIKTASVKSIEIEVWDPNNVHSTLIILEASSPHWSGIKTDLLPHSFLAKNTKQVSCFFGKRKHLLKEGDWLIRTKRGWRHLRQNTDKALYLKHKIFGELFIFESLTKDSGKWMIKGILVDEMRTQTQPFSALVATDASSAKPKTLKKTIAPYKPDIVSNMPPPSKKSFYEDQQDDD